MDEALQKAITLIKEFEGCKLKAYQDQMGRWTIGWGTTQASLLGFSDYQKYPPIQIGTFWSQEQADCALTETLQGLMEQLKSLLGPVLLASLNSNQLAAVVDFVYNLGIGSFQHSGLLRGLRMGNYTAAAQNILLWDRVGSYVSPGLTRRRQAEYQLFRAPLETPPTDPTNTAPQPTQPPQSD